MKKTIFAFGFDLPSIEGFEVLDFTSNRSMLEADIIAIEPNLWDFEVYGSFEGTPKMTEHSSFQFRKLRQSWRTRLMAALETGKTVVAFLPERDDRFHYTGQQRNDGTPGRPRLVNIVSGCSSYDFLPVDLAAAPLGRGTSMILSSSADLLSAYWKEFGPKSVYHCHFESGKAIELVLTRSGKNVVGALLPKWGKLLYLPEVDWSGIPRTVTKQKSTSEVSNENSTDDGIEADAEEDDETEWEEWSPEILEFTRQLRNALFELDTRLSKERVITAPPEWVGADEFRLNSEAPLEAKIIAVGERIAALGQEQDELTRSLEREAGLRGLLYEGGHPLEEAVREALAVLGFDASNFKEADSEFDALFTSPEGRFLGEVEGKESKAISVDKISQLHRNVVEDFAREEVADPAIPVLFGNAFRLKPLAERGDYFTEKVVKFAATSGTALVRTPDLFVAARYIKNSGDKAFAKKCRLAIRDGMGGQVAFPETPADAPPEPSEIAG
jgi:hypothetical protein